MPSWGTTVSDSLQGDEGALGMTFSGCVEPTLLNLWDEYGDD